jgi:hypothetical protein
MMFTKEEKEKREKLEYIKENPPYVFDPARIRSKHDDFDDYTTYETDPAPVVENGNQWYAIRMTAFQKGLTNVFVSIKASYTGKKGDRVGADWIFVNKVTLLGANGQQYSFSDEDPRRDIDVFEGVYLHEKASSVVSESELNLLESILLSGKVRVRFSSNSSNGYTVDWEMRGYQKRSCLDIINAYKRLKAASNKTKADAAPKATRGKE